MTKATILLLSVICALSASAGNSVCVSSDLYQDLPRLTKNGELLPYTKWQSELLRNTQEDQTCQQADLPDEMLLRSNEPTVVDWMILVDDSQAPIGAMPWYDPLTPGVYELSIQRRFDFAMGQWSSPIRLVLK